MKTACPKAFVADAASLGALSPSTTVRRRWLDYLELTKPRISLMVLFTVAIGALLAPAATIDSWQVLHALIGTALVASGASALNQWLERHTDAQMRRTENRPLPAGRLTSAEVLTFGFTLGLGGVAYMLALMTHPLAAGITAATFVSYVFIYTPLKRVTTLNTLIGAVPGALPPVIGWTAMTGTLDTPALVLFLLVFFWQVPHFLAIAWIYREDYGRAGLKMLPVVDGDGMATVRQMLVYTLALAPISLLPLLLGGGSAMYGFGALGLGVYFLRSVWGFAATPTTPAARKVLHASLVYLPGVLGIMLIERLIRFFLVEAQG